MGGGAGVEPGQDRIFAVLGAGALPPSRPLPDQPGWCRVCKTRPPRISDRWLGLQGLAIAVAPRPRCCALGQAAAEDSGGLSFAQPRVCVAGDSQGEGELAFWGAWMCLRACVCICVCACV